MGSYYNVYKAHHYRNNTSDAHLTDLHAGMDLLYLRGAPKCAVDTCPTSAGSSQQVNKTLEALEAATNGSRPDARLTLQHLDTKAATALRLRFELGEFDHRIPQSVCPARECNRD